MKYPLLLPLLLVILIFVLLGCQEESGPTGQAPIEYRIQTPESPIAKGGRLLAVGPTESDRGFDASFAEVRKVGTQFVELNLSWQDFEPSPGTYQDFDNILSAISVFGTGDIQVAFSLANINTVQRTEPDYLADKSFDDPEYVQAFTNLVDYIMTNKAENVSVAYISIGNEVDIYLNGDDWAAYRTFLAQSIAHIQQHYPGIPVSTKVTVMDGLLGPKQAQVLDLLALTDVAMLNYYPQNTSFQVLGPNIVDIHLEQITRLVQKPIYFTELGYQSGSEYAGSSEAQQAEFYHNFFQRWDDYLDQIKLVNIVWLHDVAPEQVTAWQSYYGINEPAFAEYLGTLGVRHHDHTDKPAWQQILTDAKARGW